MVIIECRLFSLEAMQPETIRNTRDKYIAPVMGQALSQHIQFAARIHSARNIHVCSIIDKSVIPSAGWFRAGGGCILAKRGNEGGFVATPAFTSSTPGTTLASRLIYLTRHGELERLALP